MSDNDDDSRSSEADTVAAGNIPADPRALLSRNGRRDGKAISNRLRQYGALLEYAPDAIVIVDADGMVTEWNPAAEVMLGTTRSQAVGASVRAVFLAAHANHFDAAWQQLISGQFAQRFEFKTSEEGIAGKTLGVIVAPIRSRNTIAGAVVIFRDLAAKSLRDAFPGSMTGETMGADSARETLPADTALDTATDLPGRRWLQRLLSTPPASGLERGVAVLDLDAFAILITTYGADAAESVLSRFAELLISLDTSGAFVYWRAGSFVWTVDAPDAVAALNQCVATLTKALHEPFQVGEERGWLTLSIGLATSTDVADGDLLAAAGDALKSARDIGGTSAVYYDEAMQANVSSSFRLSNDLHHAIENEELRLHYQPIMDFTTNEITGAEALVRWERPGVGLLAPGAFIDVAERTGQIVPLGNWVVRKACSDALRLGRSSAGPRTMSINVSARHLRDPSLLTTLKESMAAGECAPSTIVIEVTESVLLDDLCTVAASLDAIKALDVGLDLDDFGTGYSSLHYLRNLPIDRLKIDKSFVAGLGTSGADTAIVASTIALAHALGLQSIAEGVETPQQLALLREMGCDFAQGYLLSRPVDMEAFVEWLECYVPAEGPLVGGTIPSDMPGGRDSASDLRDAQADRRETEADDRDAGAAARATEADHRDTTADERERVADERDAVASVREHAEDDRQRATGASGQEDHGESASSRRAAKRDRHIAKAKRNVKASDRAQAEDARDED